jgi:hypothetical protein
MSRFTDEADRSTGDDARDLKYHPIVAHEVTNVGLGPGAPGPGAAARGR